MVVACCIAVCCCLSVVVNAVDELNAMLWCYGCFIVYIWLLGLIWCLVVCAVLLSLLIVLFITFGVCDFVLSVVVDTLLV